MADSVKTPSRRTAVILGAIAVAVVVAGAAVAAVVLGGSRSGGGDGATRDLVKIEVRAPGATIKFRGKDMGRAPITLQLPRSNQPQVVEATFTLHKMNLATRQAVNQTRTATKTFVPDDHQSVDFAPADAKDQAQ